MANEKIAVVYARVSTARQAEENLPLESQNVKPFKTRSMAS